MTSTSFGDTHRALDFFGEAIEVFVYSPESLALCCVRSQVTDQRGLSGVIAKLFESRLIIPHTELPCAAGARPWYRPGAPCGAFRLFLPRAEEARQPKAVSSLAVRSKGMRVAQGLVGMPLGGAVIGWLLDRLFDTAPWIMLALMFIGFGGAVWDAMKTFGQGDRDAGK